MTGLIEGLPSTGTDQPASDVIIQSLPAGVNQGSFTLPYDLGANGWDLSPNDFTTSGGSITAAAFGAEDGNGDILDLNDGGGNTFANGTTSDYVTNDSGFDGVTFTPVPEPASLSLIGVGGLLLLQRRRRRITVSGQ